MKSLSVAAVGLGIALLVGSLVWGFLFPATNSWTNEKQQQMTDLGLKAHKLGAALDAVRRRPSTHGPSAAELEAEYQQVRTDHARLAEEFSGAQNAPKQASRFLRWSGVAFVVAGALVMFASRDG